MLHGGYYGCSKWRLVNAATGFRGSAQHRRPHPQCGRETAIKVHKLRDNISVLEGSGGDIAVVTSTDSNHVVDAGITVSRLRILEAANGLSREPITHLINTHWHFDHTDGNQWLNAEGAAIIAHENTHKHLLVAQRVEDWDFNFPSPPLSAVPTETFSSEKT